jgi:rare lipoprotein A
VRRLAAAALALVALAAGAQERPDDPAGPGLLKAPAAALRKAAGEAAEVGRGIASWYGKRFHGRRTASGERFDMHALTAAHRTLPFGTVVRVTSLVNGRTVDVRINDRGPHLKQRVIDLSQAAARVLGLLESGAGTKPVVLSIVRPGAAQAAADPVPAEAAPPEPEVPALAPAAASPPELAPPVAVPQPVAPRLALPAPGGTPD